MMSRFHNVNILALVVWCLLNHPVARAEPDEERTSAVVDRSSSAAPSGNFSYRRLASSFLPATQVGEWRVKISSDAQLFVDDYMVHSMQGLKRTLHQAKFV